MLGDSNLLTSLCLRINFECLCLPRYQPTNFLGQY